MGALLGQTFFYMYMLSQLLKQKFIYLVWPAQPIPPPSLICYARKIRGGGGMGLAGQTRQGYACTGWWWSASTTTQPSFTTTQAILTSHNRVKLEILYQMHFDCNNGSFLELEKPPLKSLWAEPCMCTPCFQYPCVSIIPHHSSSPPLAPPL